MPSHHESLRIVLLGPPGSGKGTQGKRVAQCFGVPHVSTGDLIRDQIARRTDFGIAVEAAIAAGNFAADADIVPIVLARLAEPDAATGYVLDGFPRDLAQAKLFTEKLGDAADRVIVVYLDLPSDKVVARLSGRLTCPTCDTVYHEILRPPKLVDTCDLDGSRLVRRPDDDPIAVRHRLDVYDDLTLPLRHYYETRGTLRSIRADRTPDSVFADIFSAVQSSGQA